MVYPMPFNRENAWSRMVFALITFSMINHYRQACRDYAFAAKILGQLIVPMMPLIPSNSRNRMLHLLEIGR